MADVGPARERIAAAAARSGRDPGDVEIVAATKYVALEDLGALVEAGVTRVGENRAQDLQAKHAEYGDRFTWDFIGHVQSRKVPQILPLVQRIHSVGSDSVLGRLERHLELARPGFERLQGGMGYYPSTSAHPPFVHVDVRGTKARWKG